MKLPLIFSLFCIVSLFSENGRTAVSVGGTRLIYDAGQKEASITVSNSEKGSPILIQSWVDEGESSKVKSPFIVTPPLFRLDPGQDNILRVVRTGGKIPEDRESLYWLNIKSIPSVKKSDIRSNTLQLAIKNRIKFIYRPVSVAGTPEENADKLIWKRVGNQVQVTNPTAFVMNFGLLTIGGKTFKPSLPEQTFIEPKSVKMFSVPASTTTNSISWKIINDYGGTSKEWTAKF